MNFQPTTRRVSMNPLKKPSINDFSPASRCVALVWIFEMWALRTYMESPSGGRCFFSVIEWELSIFVRCQYVCKKRTNHEKWVHWCIEENLRQRYTGTYIRFLNYRIWPCPWKMNIRNGNSSNHSKFKEYIQKDNDAWFLPWVAPHAIRRVQANVAIFSTPPRSL